MYNITIRFYEELNDFLDDNKKKRDIEFSFDGRRSIKDLIESFGVPHVEVDMILVNGESVDFKYIVKDGDRISVYPVFESLDVGQVARLRPNPLRDTRFVLDVHLRSLARRLRLMGFDVDYKEDRDDRELAKISEEQNRILLTRDRRLLMHKNVSRGIIIRNTGTSEQLCEVLERLDLRSMCRPFSRCIACNGIIHPLDLNSPGYAAAEEKIPSGVRDWCREYFICDNCHKIYWKGSHYEKLKAMVEKFIQDPDQGGSS